MELKRKGAAMSFDTAEDVRSATAIIGGDNADTDFESDEVDDEFTHTHSWSSSQSKSVSIKRPAMNQLQFNERFGFEGRQGLFRFPSPNTHRRLENGRRLRPRFTEVLAKKIRRWKRALEQIQFMEFLGRLLPILVWLPAYKWRTNFVNDLVAGFTVAVMHVPQGLAYAMLANVDAISGIYTAFFPVIIYIFMGTSRHISMGTFAVISILVSKPVIENCENRNLMGNESLPHHDLSRFVAKSSEEIDCEIKVTVALSFLVGVIQLCMGLLKLGVLSSLLSDALVSGFTTGAAVHVFSSQLPHLFGIPIPRSAGAGRLIKAVSSLWDQFHVNRVALGISGSCIALLLLHDFLVKPRLNQKCKYPIPIQFIVVILGTTIAYLLNLHETQDITVVGVVPTGMPIPVVSFADRVLLKSLVVDAFGIALIGYVISLSLARIVATRHRYQIDANQELVAQGCSTIFGSFFQSLPMTGSLSRTMVQETAGGKTLMTSAISVFILAWVFLFFGPLFYHLPKSVLSSIIVVSLLGVFNQFKELVQFAKRSLSDAFVWVTTFTFTVLLDVDLGLAIGLTVSLLFLIAWGYFPKIELVGITEFSDLYIPADSYSNGTFYGDTIVVRISGNLNMANVTSVCSSIDELLDEDSDLEWTGEKSKYLILDISPVTHVDYSACQHFISIYKYFGKLGKIVAFAGARPEIWQRFESCQVFEEVSKEVFYPTVQDAITLLPSQCSH